MLTIPRDLRSRYPSQQGGGHAPLAAGVGVGGAIEGHGGEGGQQVCWVVVWVVCV